MSKTRTIARSILRQRTERAAQIAKQCPVCGTNMKLVWYSRHKSKCPECKTSVCVPWINWR